MAERGPEGGMASPRTIAGQAAISALRPHLKRALGPTILRIEAEAVAPYLDALREPDRVLAAIAASAARADPSVRQAEAAHRRLAALLETDAQPERT